MVDTRGIVDINSQYTVALNEICLPIFNLLNITYFTYFSIFFSKQTRSIAYSDNATICKIPNDQTLQIIFINPAPQILKFYLANEYYLCDPHIVAPKNLLAGITLWSSYDDTEYQGKYMYALREKFNINNGVTLIKKSPSSYDGFCFGVSKTNTEFFANVFNNTFLLNQFSNYFINKTIPIMDGFLDAALNVYKLKGNKFTSQPGITKNCTVTKKAYHNFMLSMGMKNIEQQI